MQSLCCKYSVIIITLIPIKTKTRFRHFHCQLSYIKNVDKSIMRGMFGRSRPRILIVSIRDVRLFECDCDLMQKRRSDTVRSDRRRKDASGFLLNEPIAIRPTHCGKLDLGFNEGQKTDVGRGKNAIDERKKSIDYVMVEWPRC